MKFSSHVIISFHQVFLFDNSSNNIILKWQYQINQFPFCKLQLPFVIRKQSLITKLCKCNFAYFPSFFTIYIYLTYAFHKLKQHPCITSKIHLYHPTFSLHFRDAYLNQFFQFAASQTINILFGALNIGTKFLLEFLQYQYNHCSVSSSWLSIAAELHVQISKSVSRYRIASGSFATFTFSLKLFSLTLHFVTIIIWNGRYDNR